MTNKELADLFTTIGDILEIQGEGIYKIIAYRRAAESLRQLSRDAGDYWREGKLREIPGVGAAIEEKIDEIQRTGKLQFYEKLKAQVPPGVVEMLAVDTVGPKRAAVFWKQLNITSLAQLEAAARGGKLHDLPGMGAKSEAKIIASIEALTRRVVGRTPLGIALPLARQWAAALKELPGVERVEIAGSLRRCKSTIGDIDLLVTAPDSEVVMDAFNTLPGVINVLGRGPTKSSIEFSNGLKAQVWVHPAQEAGTALQYATGSKDHNVRLREMAQAKGLSLSDHSFKRENGSEIFCATEEEVYKIVGLPWIPPELREGQGEIQAARAGKLPKLIELADLQSDLHTHSNWSDGKNTVLQMARAAQERGLKCIAVTDHSQSLGVTGGVRAERFKDQHAEIDRAQKAIGPGFRILKGTEVEIRADGTLDYTDEVLATLDLVIASLHTSLRQPREQVTARMLAAVRNPHVDIIGHPTGRLIPNREGADLDMEAVLAAARDSGVALEVNANPERLDLEDVYIRRALELGCTLTINTDAHAPNNYDLAEYGIATARRGWATAPSVINTWTTDKLEDWLKARNSRPPVVVDAPPAHAPLPVPASAESPAPPARAARGAKTKSAPARKPAAKKAVPAKKKAAAKKSPAKKPAAQPAPRGSSKPKKK